jgi:beta-galactosidase
MAEQRYVNEGKLSLWNPGNQAAAELVDRTIEKSGDAYRIVDVLRYLPDGNGPPELTITTTYRLGTGGTLTVTSESALSQMDALPLEYGLAIKIDPSPEKLSWIGSGPYSGYPGKNSLNNPGVYSLATDDRYFEGFRDRVERLRIGNDNQAFQLSSVQQNFGWEPSGQDVFLYTNAITQGLGTKFQLPMQLDRLDSNRLVLLSLTIVPEAENHWMAGL